MLVRMFPHQQAHSPCPPSYPSCSFPESIYGATNKDVKGDHRVLLFPANPSGPGEHQILLQNNPIPFP